MIVFTKSEDKSSVKFAPNDDLLNLKNIQYVTIKFTDYSFPIKLRSLQKKVNEVFRLNNFFQKIFWSNWIFFKCIQNKKSKFQVEVILLSADKKLTGNIEYSILTFALQFLFWRQARLFTFVSFC